eukprot:scaffold7106_cov121-Cylindrotheca_fusiformis.AAC.4
MNKTCALNLYEGKKLEIVYVVALDESFIAIVSARDGTIMARMISSRLPRHDNNKHRYQQSSVGFRRSLMFSSSFGGSQMRLCGLSIGHCCLGKAGPFWKTVR